MKPAKPPITFSLRPRPERLPRSKYVTICVGFNRGSGIVLAADTEETFSGFKRRQPKLEIRPRNGDYSKACAVFAGAGDGPLIDHLTDKLWEAMERGTALNAMIKKCEDELIRTYRRLTPAFHTEHMPEMQMLVGVWCQPDSLELIEITNSILTRNIISKSIGSGYTLSSYIEQRLLYEKADLSDVIPLAVYMVDEAKRHVDGCGGETHVVTLSANGQVKRFHDFDVAAKSKRIAEIDRLARQIGAVAMNETIRDDGVRSAIEQFGEAIIRARQKADKP